MDKYTVDLDKVLNDFEYSELTEQSEQQVCGSARNGATKHSINNVFSSLNDYLSTEIVDVVEEQAEIAEDDGLERLRLMYEKNRTKIDNYIRPDDNLNNSINVIAHDNKLNVDDHKSNQSDNKSGNDDNKSAGYDNKSAEYDNKSAEYDKTSAEHDNKSIEAEILKLNSDQNYNQIQNRAVQEVLIVCDDNKAEICDTELPKPVGFDVGNIEIDENELSDYFDNLEAELRESKLVDSNSIEPKPNLEPKSIESQLVESQTAGTQLVESQAAGSQSQTAGLQSKSAGSQSKSLGLKVESSKSVEGELLDSRSKLLEFKDSKNVESKLEESNLKLVEAKSSDSELLDSESRESKLVEFRGKLFDSKSVESKLAETNLKLVEAEFSEAKLLESDLEPKCVDETLVESKARAELLESKLATFQESTSIESKLVEPNLKHLEPKSVEAKLTDSKSIDEKFPELDAKLTDSKSSEAKLADSKSIEERVPDSKSMEGKLADLKSMEGKISDSKSIEGKISDSKSIEGKLPDSKSIEGKLLHSKAIQEQLPDLKSKESQVDESTSSISRESKLEEFTGKLQESKFVGTKLEESNLEPKILQLESQGLDSSKLVDSKYTKSKATDGKSTESELVDSKYTKSKVVDSKSTESKLVDSKCTESKLVESKYKKSKLELEKSELADSKSMESTVVDSKSTDSESTKSKLVDSKSTDSKLVDSKSMESKLIDSKSRESELVDSTKLGLPVKEVRNEEASDVDGSSGSSEYEVCCESCSDEAGEVEAVAEKEDVADESISQSERPNSLVIGGKAESKREINLIGNPGSTPYNNLYVSKEISLDKTKPHYESESSASVSPTFSEASTDSVRSTDSSDLEPECKEQANPTKASEEASGSGDVAEAAGGPVQPKPDAKGDGPDNLEEIYVDINSINAAAGDNVESQAATQPEVPENEVWLGKRAPVWIPDSDALNCMHCDMKFTVIKRRHHCRACGLVLCSKCCSLKHRLEYLDSEARVCTKCYDVLSRDSNSSSGSEVSPTAGNSPSRQAAQQPNPNNPMEYCSVVPPLQQVSGATENPPTVMVPVGVLKRKGSNKAKHNKSVMFCDGIRPGSDLTNLDNDFNYNESKTLQPTSAPSSSSKKHHVPKVNRNVPLTDPTTKSFIPENKNCLPPTMTTFKSDTTYTECANNVNVVEMLKNETLTFAIQRNLQIHARLITMDCCVNKQAWCFTTEGLISVGQDEIVVLVEYIENEKLVPKDVFYHLNNIFNDAVKGTTITELDISMHPTPNFLDSKNHAGFIYIRPTFQCLQNVIVPKEPYLIGVLVHRWETPWAKIFPLRLVLRLGAEYRYYPSPLISTRHRDSVFVEIGHTIINLLADFRNFSYTLPNIRGLTIHMEEKNTTVTIPVNRYDQVMKSISNSSDHILAFGGNFSTTADSHLVCIQDTQGNNENNYTTHAINIQNKPRKVTGASFIVFNGALKSTSGLTAKSSIVEDGLMIQIPAEHMVQVRESLRNMKNHTIQCGCVNAASDETVSIVWGEPDVNFNIGVKSSVDEQSLSGVPSIRVHNGKDYVCNSGNRLIRWTEVFLLQKGEENARTQDPPDISKVAEIISTATCQALVKYLDLLATNNFYKIGIRTTLHIEHVSYSAGSNGIKLPPIYMKSLDNELIPVLHRITSINLADSEIVLELIFRILNV